MIIRQGVGFAHRLAQSLAAVPPARIGCHRREWEGDRGTKAAPDVGKHLVFSFLTTDASPDVAPIHPDATPVLLLDQAAPTAGGRAQDRGG